MLRGTQDFEVVGRRERVGVIKDDMEKARGNVIEQKRKMLLTEQSVIMRSVKFGELWRIQPPPLTLKSPGGFIGPNRLLQS